MKAEEARLLVEERRDGPVDERERAGVGLVGVDHRLHVGPGLVDGGVERALHRGLEGPLDDAEVEIEHADVGRGHHPVVEVGRRDGHGGTAGDADREVAAGGDQVAAGAEPPGGVDDGLLDGDELGHGRSDHLTCREAR
jgi:hypothetical protein